MIDITPEDDIKARAVWFLRVRENMTYTEIKKLTGLTFTEIADLEWLGDWLRKMDRFRVQNCGRELQE